MSQDIVLADLSNLVVNCEVDKIKDAVKEAIDKGLSPVDIIEKGLADGARTMGDRFQKGELFLTELVLAGEAMKAGIEVLRPEMTKRKLVRRSLGKITIGTVKGDIHDIGKGIVAVMLEATGFELVDLGVDVAPERFLENVNSLQPEILGMSALLSTTAPELKVVVTTLEKANSRRKVKIIVGGAAVNPELASQIGADGYSDNAVDAVKMTKNLVGAGAA